MLHFGKNPREGSKIFEGRGFWAESSLVIIFHTGSIVKQSKVVIHYYILNFIVRMALIFTNKLKISLQFSLKFKIFKITTTVGLHTMGFRIKILRKIELLFISNK